jgi:hypothetical protein
VGVPTPYPYNVFTPADIDSTGTHYFVQNLSRLFALNPDGSQRWQVTRPDYVAGPIVDPLNTQLIMGSAATLDHAGFIVSTAANDGHELWRVVLPVEDPTVFNSAIGIYGFNQYVDTRARFSGDGARTTETVIRESSLSAPRRDTVPSPLARHPSAS